MIALPTINTFSPSSTKEKSRVTSKGLEILNGAELKLKAGTHYTLLGQNNTVKPTLL